MKLPDCTQCKHVSKSKPSVNNNGYEVERIDRIDDKTVMYILKKEVDGEEPEND